SFDRATLIASEVFEVTLPAAAPVRLRHAPDLPPEITTIGERTTYRWTHEVLELPGAPEPEPYDPHALTPIPDIELSTFPDWASVGDWYAELALERARPTAELRRRAAELTAGIEDDRARIRALYDFVRRHVRYLGLQFGAARYQPHPAAEIL